MIVTDNAANMKKAVNDSLQLPWGSWAIQTLQVAVTDNVCSQRGINDIIKMERKLEGHFDHSALATQKLKKHKHS